MLSKNKILIFFIIVVLLSSCYDKSRNIANEPIDYTENQLDSISFLKSHHYTQNFNFVVKADSLVLIRQQPEETLSSLPIDSFSVKHDALLVVADIRIIPNGNADSVWVQLASDQLNFGWIQESNLLPKVDPDDPISQFISLFSNTHLLIFLIIVCIISVSYGLRILFKKNAYIVHFKDINSFYPTLLTLIVASSAAFYASIQHFSPESWRNFYFNPTLNPFTQPPLLLIFLASVWSMLIVAIAAIDDTFRHLPFGESILYLCGLTGICAIDYIIFSITTLYYVGYLLLIAYFAFALWRYFAYNRTHYICGNCSQRIKQKGRCPYCGAMNI
ncbi:MAG: zinc ribbon domain-containing protein [Prevotella sp.]|jgi:hypothetical protein|nr:zinc ribbon domain-containing protein [Prevotella sp.]